MKYEEELAKKLINPDGYLWFKDSSPLSYLDGIAIDSYDKGTTEGYFLAAVIYHQLTEQILTLLIRYSDLIIQGNIYPAKLDVHYEDLNTFGKLLNRHKTTVHFKNKSGILRRSNEINNNRIQLVHKILELGNANRIDTLSKNIRDNFVILFKEWKESMDWFYNPHSGKKHT